MPCARSSSSRRTTFAGLSLVAVLIAAAIPGAVAGSRLGPVASEPLAIETVATVARPLAASRVVIPSARSTSAREASAAVADSARPARSSQATGWIERADTDVPRSRARTVATITPITSGSAPSTSYTGRDHVWIPALGVDRSIAFFACTSSAYPGDRVYRWGCAGSNNVYLFGHAYSVFKPLHDAYVRGDLRKGMQVIYADGNGKVSTYAVSWWRITTPDKGEFAYAAQGAPSLTLQTCVGAKSQYRLIVRLKKVG